MEVHMRIAIIILILLLPIAWSPSCCDAVPEVEDFVPLGLHYVLDDNNVLHYVQDGTPWRLSCFILVAQGRDGMGRIVAYEGRLPFTGEGPFRPRLHLDPHLGLGTTYYVSRTLFGGNLYYFPEGWGTIPFPTVLSKGTGGSWQCIAYDRANRTWIHVVEARDFSLYMVCRAEDHTFWISSMDGPWQVHGVLSRVPDYDLWVGFWDHGLFNATLRLAGREIEFSGFFVFDRAIHRLALGIRGRSSGLPLAFSCMIIKGDDFRIFVSMAKDPSPLHLLPMEKQMKIIVDDEVFYTSSFELIDFGNPLQPSAFILIGSFHGGKIWLKGHVVAITPQNGWTVERGSWWDRGARCTWGRAYVRWSGYLIIHGRTVYLNGYGIGEFTRFSPSYFSKITPFFELNYHHAGFHQLA